MAGSERGAHGHRPHVVARYQWRHHGRGYTISGGLSWFGRKYGIAAHQIRAVELVDADGNHRRVTPERDAELLWAIRGGGGEFGIVTALELQLLPGPQIYGGRKLWSAEHGRDLLRSYAQITAGAPDELSLWAWLMNMPDVEQVPVPLRGRVMIAFGLTYLGTPAEAEALLAPLYAIAEAELGQFTELPLKAIGDIAQEPQDPMPAMGRVHLLSDHIDASIDGLLDEITGGSSPIAMLQIRHLGGALTDATSADGPVGSVEEPYLVLMGAVAPVPELPPMITQASDRLTGALKPSITNRVPMTLSEADPIDQIFDQATLTRLRAIKDHVDPRHRIRGNHPLN